MPVLAARFLAELSEEYGRRLELAPEALDRLLGCGWSGNVRQLRNCLERAAVSCGRSVLGAADVCPRPEACGLEAIGSGRSLPAVPGAAPPPQAPAPAGAPDERERVRLALERSGFVQAKAPRLLGMTPRQLAYRVRKYGITLDRF